MCYLHQFLTKGLKGKLLRQFLAITVVSSWGMLGLHAADSRSSGNPSGNSDGPVKVNVVHMDSPAGGDKFQIEKTPTLTNKGVIHLTNDAKLKTTGPQKPGDKSGNFKNTANNPGLSEKGFAAKNIFDNAEGNLHTTPTAALSNDHDPDNEPRGGVKEVQISSGAGTSGSGGTRNNNSSSTGEEKGVGKVYKMGDGSTDHQPSSAGTQDTKTTEGTGKTFVITDGDGTKDHKSSSSGTETQGLVQEVQVSTPPADGTPTVTTPVPVPKTPPLVINYQQIGGVDNGASLAGYGATTDPSTWNIPGGGINLGNGHSDNPFDPHGGDDWKNGPDFGKFKLQQGDYSFGGWDGENGTGRTGGVDSSTSDSFSNPINTSPADSGSVGTAIDTGLTAGQQVANGGVGGAATTVGTAVAPGAAGVIEYGVGVATGDQGKIKDGADKTGAAAASKIVGFFEGLIIAVGGLLAGGAVVAVAEKSGAADAARGAIGGLISSGLQGLARLIGGGTHCGGGEGGPDEPAPKLTGSEKKELSWGQRFSATLQIWAQAWGNQPSGPDPTGEHTKGDHASMTQRQLTQEKETMGLSGGQGDIDPDAVKAHGSGAALKQAAQIGFEQHK